MPRVVLRVGKRKTSWETKEVETIVQTEFKERNGVLDLRPSVYVVDAPGNEAALSEVVRVVAEHTASFLSDPPKGTRNPDLNGLADMVQTPGNSKFAFANAHHHEISLQDADALRDLVRRALSEI